MRNMSIRIGIVGLVSQKKCISTTFFKNFQRRSPSSGWKGFVINVLFALLLLLSSHATRNFSGHGKFLGIGALWQMFHVRQTKERLHRETFLCFFSGILLKLQFKWKYNPLMHTHTGHLFLKPGYFLKQNQGTFFYFKKSEGKNSPPPPSAASCPPYYSFSYRLLCPYSKCWFLYEIKTRQS